LTGDNDKAIGYMHFARQSATNECNNNNNSNNNNKITIERVMG